ncbi:MAG: hypothetical protein QXL94_00895 [Candidatus Parvarchaeum sp.]
MPKKTQIETESESEEMPVRETGEAEQAAYMQMQKLGYLRYTFAKEFEAMDLDTDPRSYPVAKKVDVVAIKEKDGKAPYIGLGFVGVLDEKLFLMVMEKEEAEKSIAKSKGKNDTHKYIGLEFFGVNKRFGGIGTVALPIEAYNKLAQILQE